MTNICYLQRHTRRMCDASTNDAFALHRLSHVELIDQPNKIFADCARFTARVQTDSAFIIQV